MGLIIVDGNSIGHANHSGALLTAGAMETQMIYGTVKSLRGMATKYHNYQIIVLWDGKTRWRQQIYSEYKGNRLAKDEKEQASKDSYEKQVKYARKMIQHMGIGQCYATTHEADDIARQFIDRALSANKDVILCTGDKDWLQYVQPGVMWFDPIRDRMANHSTFFEFTGYRTPYQFVQGKALQGDISDNIPGVGKIGEKGAPELLAQFGSVENFWKMVDEGAYSPKTKAQQHLATPETREVFNRNMKLMSLRDAPAPLAKDMVIISPDYNESKFLVMCEALAFRSIAKDVSGFLEPFRKTERKAA